MRRTQQHLNVWCLSQSFNGNIFINTCGQARQHTRDALTHLHIFLADRLTLYQQEGADYAHNLVASPQFFGTWLQHWVKKSFGRCCCPIRLPRSDLHLSQVSQSVTQSLSQSVTQSSSSCLASLSISPLVAWSNFEKIPPVGKWRARAVLITWWSSATIVEPAVVYSSTPASMRQRVEPGAGVVAAHWGGSGSQA